MLQVLKQVSRTYLRPSVQIVSLINSEHPESPALLRAKGDQTLAQKQSRSFSPFSFYPCCSLAFPLACPYSLVDNRYNQYHCRPSTHDALGDTAELSSFIIIAVISTRRSTLDQYGFSPLLAGVIIDQNVYLLSTHVACRAAFELETELRRDARRESIFHPLRGMELGSANCSRLHLGAGEDLYWHSRWLDRHIAHMDRQDRVSCKLKIAPIKPPTTDTVGRNNARPQAQSP